LIFKEEAFKRSELKDFDLFADRIAKSLKLKYNSPADLRIFNINGQEQFAQDLAFFKDKEVIYISTGQDFDIKSYYSQYEIEKTLGAGGFGKVVLGVNKLDGEKVAIKITNPEAIENAQDLDSLFAEAETLKGLNHPNIVKFKNCFVIKKTLQAYFIMEYLEGGELLEYLREKGQLAEDEAAEIFKQILSAVDYCHRQKVIHRDLKLENILRESKDTVVFKVCSP
jgi:serine/threonine protein kinase